MTTRWTVLWTAAALIFTACPSPTDLGVACVLIRKDPADPEHSIPITEGEITPNKDFISFGATECENLVCVREANTPVGSDPAAVATGICTRPCVPTDDQSCATGDRGIDGDADRSYACRPLLLDQDTLAAMREADPVKYQRYFGTTTSPDFCVGPALP